MSVDMIEGETAKLEKQMEDSSESGEKVGSVGQVASVTSA